MIGKAKSMQKPIHGGNIWEAVENYGLDIEDMVDFSSNINPLGPPHYVEKMVGENIDKLTLYPDPHYKTLIHCIAQNVGVGDENIAVGNGSSELIYLISRILSPKVVLIIQPTFSEYEHAFRLSDAKIYHFFTHKNRRFRIDLALLLSKIANIDDLHLIILGNPNNPTGTILPKAELISLVNYCESRDIFILIDEVFMDFMEREEDYTLSAEAGRKDHLIILRSFTKFYSLPGIRVGYLIGPHRVVDRIKSHQPPWSVNILAQIIPPELIKDKHFKEKSLKLIKDERDHLFQGLSKIRSLKPYPSAANFILCEIKAPIKSSELKEILARKGLLIRDCSSFMGLNSKFFRVAVRNREENDMLLRRMQEIFHGEGKNIDDPGNRL